MIQSNENQAFDETKSKEALQDILVSLEDSGADGVKLTTGCTLLNHLRPV
jgi:hypothetical protein